MNLTGTVEARGAGVWVLGAEPADLEAGRCSHSSRKARSSGLLATVDEMLSSH